MSAMTGNAGETVPCSVSGDMMQGEKDAGIEHVFVNSLEFTSNDAFEVPPRREPVFFLESTSV